MSLKNYSHEDIKKMSMIEISNLVLSDKKETIPFKELFDEIASLKEFTDDQKTDYIAQFYTDINIDGRFVNTGSNHWGLKRWYPVKEVIKETQPTPKQKTKKKAAKKQKPESIEEDETEENLDSLEELTGDFSSLDGKDDVDEDVEEFDVFADELDEIDEGFDDEEDEDEYEEEEEVK